MTTSNTSTNTGRHKRDTFYFWFFLLHIPTTILIDSSFLIPSSFKHHHLNISSYLNIDSNPSIITVTSAIESSLTNFLNFQNNILKFHIDQNHDFMALKPPFWLKVFVFFELAFQLPLFFILVFDYLSGGNGNGNGNGSGKTNTNKANANSKGRDTTEDQDKTSASQTTLTTSNSKFSAKWWLLIFTYGLNASFTTVVCLIYVFLEGESNGLQSNEIYQLLGVYCPYLLIPGMIAIDYYRRIQDVLLG
ncbi:unnamed protein product [Ambrosiozyma monospora]|uniref:Unnamed protein product n=1 Tax=Ambrosiozyma monospora TaxID=43982 RepID=A0ACB5T5U5_AMBMO|nr:unnamed protein product [Ambrosiozyma monospora]